VSPKSPPASRGEGREDYVGPNGTWRPGRPEGLARVVAKAGYGSRAHAEAMVCAGRVTVDGHAVVDPSLAVDATSRITLDGRQLVEAPRRYFAFHKPARADGKGAVEAILPQLFAGLPGLEPVGRLDPRTSGLVLIANDHWWNAAILSRRQLEREFVVRVQGELCDAEVGIMLGGVHLHGMGYVRPIEVRVLARDAEATRLRLALRGTKIRQIRGLFQSLRHDLLDLAVVRIGVVRLGDLGQSQARPLTRAEVQAMQLG
jgi:23S rRNA pseudouridine2605 synthase